jgi:proteasome accessory factor C
MSAADRLSRLLALVPWLTTHGGVTLAECADHFQVSEEQLERDLWLLVVCGVPGYGPDQLIDIDFWTDGQVHVVDPQTLSTPMRLSSEEATTLLVALRMLAQLPGVGDRASLLSAAAKLEAASSLDTDRFVAIDVGVAQPIRDAVDAALADGRELEIEYAAATRDEVTTRTIHPLGTISIDGVTYLEAFCLLADALRTFRLDRVLEARLGGPLPTHTVVPTSISLSSGSDQVPAAPLRTVTLLLEPAARWLIDVHQAQEDPSPRSDGRSLVVLPMHDDDWAVRLVLSLRGVATMTEPSYLVAAVAAAAEAALAAYPDHIG